VFYRELGQGLDSVSQRNGSVFEQCFTQKWVRVRTVYHREMGQSLNSVLQRNGSVFGQCITEKWVSNFKFNSVSQRNGSKFELCITVNWVRVWTMYVMGLGQVGKGAVKNMQ